ncbi:ABC transporter ATP-binding protein [Metallosphaera javensis (ex Sakai et al. 2022)]|uniref:ABC transporter ATP-binding protein n=1 Tax=Metallosphaera javensis (ex Sakai et al. 2022) TaxID=2775498 RepID=UPI002589FFA4|nr:MAG: trehalose/maltose import ATP-binding protein MalK [Metallosphaera javensis (ex Sakai et al. 2022)]
METTSEELTLKVEDLWVSYYLEGREAFAVRDIYLDVGKGEVVGVVGESGSGKSTLAHAIIGLLPRNSRISKGRILFKGRDITKVKTDQRYLYRGTNIFMIFQDPMSSLNPTMKIRDQLQEAIDVRSGRRGWSVGMWKPPKGDNEEEIVDSLERVGIKRPRVIMEKYPHQLSGGERQRIMIAMAYLLKPSLLIADEPTTALDMITQAQVMRLLSELRENLGLSVLFISHDMVLVGQIADRIVVMYAGKAVEEGKAEEIIESPMHPYTKGLINSIPDGYKNEKRIESIPGSPPNILKLPSGCSFNPRCKLAMEKCISEDPETRVLGGRKVACHLY